jgi:uncharacterized membrane protein YgcG
MIRRSLIAALALAALGLLSSAATALEPAPNSYIADRANVLDAVTEAQLVKVLRELEDKTNARFVVLTVRTTAGQSIDDYALERARTWKFGANQQGASILLVVAVNDHKYTTKVVDEFRDILDESTCDSISRSQMVPQFKAGRFGQGVHDAVITFAEKIAKEREVTLDSLTAPEPAPAETSIMAENPHPENPPPPQSVPPPFAQTRPAPTYYPEPVLPNNMNFVNHSSSLPFATIFSGGACCIPLGAVGLIILFIVKVLGGNTGGGGYYGSNYYNNSSFHPFRSGFGGFGGGYGSHSGGFFGGGGSSSGGGGGFFGGGGSSSSSGGSIFGSGGGGTFSDSSSSSSSSGSSGSSFSSGGGGSFSGGGGGSSGSW